MGVNGLLRNREVLQRLAGGGLSFSSNDDSLLNSLGSLTPGVPRVRIEIEPARPEWSG
jgi:hypothetical protein